MAGSAWELTIYAESFFFHGLVNVHQSRHLSSSSLSPFEDHKTESRLDPLRIWMTTRSPDADTFNGTWIFIFELRTKLEGELREPCGAERGEGGQGEGMRFCGLRCIRKKDVAKMYHPDPGRKKS